MDFVGLARDVLVAGGWFGVGFVSVILMRHRVRGPMPTSPGIMMLHFGSSLPGGPRCWRGGRLYVVASAEIR
jgi:hypothetical protein